MVKQSRIAANRARAHANRGRTILPVGCDLELGSRFSKVTRGRPALRFRVLIRIVFVGSLAVVARPALRAGLLAGGAEASAIEDARQLLRTLSTGNDDARSSVSGAI